MGVNVTPVQTGRFVLAARYGLHVTHTTVDRKSPSLIADSHEYITIAAA